MSEVLWVVVNWRGQTWEMTPLSVAGTWLTMQVKDRGLSVPCSVLEFSLYDATCKQIPDMVLDKTAAQLLWPWLEARESKWRLGWNRTGQRPKTAVSKPVNVRQLKLFDD